jgi:hypothetical protein
MSRVTGAGARPRPRLRLYGTLEEQVGWAVGVVINAELLQAILLVGVHGRDRGGEGLGARTYVALEQPVGDMRRQRRLEGRLERLVVTREDRAASVGERRPGQERAKRGHSPWGGTGRPTGTGSPRS